MIRRKRSEKIGRFLLVCMEEVDENGNTIRAWVEVFDGNKLLGSFTTLGQARKFVDDQIAELDEDDDDTPDPTP